MSSMQQPPLGLTTIVKVDKITDGDTINVILERILKIRILNDKVYFDAPETFRPKNEEEREAGKRATQKLFELLTKEVEEQQTYYVPVDVGIGETLYRKVVRTIKIRVFREIVLHIPQTSKGRMSDVTQLGRFGGMIFADGVEVSQELINSGHTKNAIN